MKRALDVLLSALALMALSPLLALAAIATVLDSGSPVLYVQERIGKDGRPFRLLKLRTMIPGAEGLGAGLEIAPGDERITRVGRWLRASSIDELPQLANVLRGDMSLVGPRPTVRSQTDRYDTRQRRRLEVKPGITGWAQVSGRNHITWEQRIELDVWYVDNASARLDARILLATIGVLLSGKGVYGEEGTTKDL